MRHRLGFSLLHLVLLLATLTVLASVAIPTWFSRVDVTLTNAARLLAKDLRDVQDRAAFQHRALRVEFSHTGDGYVVVDLHGRPIEAPVGDGEFRRRYSRDAVFRGVRLESVEVGPNRALRFGPQGLALDGGSVVLSFEGARTRLEIEPTTGDLTLDGEPVDP